MKGDVFSIEYPILTEATDLTILAAGCTSNGNYYTSGSARDTCCCGCDKSTRE